MRIVRTTLLLLLLVLMPALAQQEAGVSEILASRDSFDGQSVSVTGVVEQFHQHTLKDGSPYTTFMLSDGKKKIRVIINEHVASKGARVQVTGVYGKKDRKVVNYKVRNGIIATKLKVL